MLTGILSPRSSDNLQRRRRKMDENEKILSGEQPEREGAPAEKKPGVG